MIRELRIKALCLGFGYAESGRAATLIVHWKGEPFNRAYEALDSFLTACKAACVEPPPEPKECCTEFLKTMPHAKACPACGQKYKRKPKSMELSDYLVSLLECDNDSFQEKAYPFGDPPSDVQNGDFHVGGWYIAEGFPVDCDVVNVSSIDCAFADAGWADAEFNTIHVGKASKADSASGKIEAVARPKG